MTFSARARSALLTVFLLVTALCAPEAPARDMHATDLAPCGANAPKQLTSLQSFITVHVACDHLLLEIPAAMLDRSILVYTEFAGLSDGASEQAPGGAVSNFVSRWIRSGNKVAMTTVKYDSWAGDHAGLKLGVEAVSLPAVIDVFDVIREGDNGSSIIDITSLFTTNVRRGFALDFMRRYRMARVDGRRSFIRNVRAFPNNVEIGSYQTWVPDEQDLLKPPPDEDPPPPSLAFSFKTNFMLLPD
ncbi:MAG TPA: DUF5117 domain-containing protein, partial [Burkholderiales bacterium]|nr:DUF5117 domain-containing protein [Burkholderiales bacterium]